MAGGGVRDDGWDLSFEIEVVVMKALRSKWLRSGVTVVCVAMIVIAPFPQRAHGDEFWQAAKDYSNSMAKLVTTAVEKLSDARDALALAEAALVDARSALSVAGSAAIVAKAAAAVAAAESVVAGCVTAVGVATAVAAAWVAGTAAGQAIDYGIKSGVGSDLSDCGAGPKLCLSDERGGGRVDSGDDL